MKALTATLCVLALAAVPLTPLWAQRGVGPWRPVRDEIGFFKDSAKVKADKQIETIKKTYAKDLVVEAIKPPKRPADVNPGDVKAVDKFFSDYAHERFSTLAVNGIYVMIVDNGKDLHKLRIEVGDNTMKKGYFTARNRDVLMEKMVERLKAGDHDGALLAATNYVADTLHANHPNPAQKTRVSPAAAAPAAVNDGASESGWNWTPILMIVGAVILVWIVFAVIRAIAARSGGGYGPGYGGAPGMGGGGGGFMSNFLGGLFGAAAGMWMYNHFFGGHGSSAWAAGPTDTGTTYPDSGPADTSSTGAGADYGDQGGGNPGGGDLGGGDAGGDWGGGADAGGGDWGGGGDFGGGGGDWGGGGGGGGGDW